jgi:hypothetical protein
MSDGSHLSFSALKDKIVWAAIAIVGLWIWRLEEKTDDQPTRDECREMIAAETPYQQDRQLIKRRLDDMEVRHTEIVTAIRDNTKAMADVRIQVERLLVIKPSEVFRKVEEMDEKVDALIENMARTRGPPTS